MASLSWGWAKSIGLVPLLLAGVSNAGFHIENVSQLRDAYDYIIVGGGTSGLTVADRLSEDSRCELLSIK
jgi:ribulose 1,5-bisphosphate synthetase/thiazole synthase